MQRSNLLIFVITNITIFLLISSLSPSNPTSFQKIFAGDVQLNYSFVKKWGSFGTGDGQFSIPQEHIAVDSKDRVYIVDGASNPRVQIFDTNGNFLGKIGSHCKMSTGEGCIYPDGSGPLSLGDGQLSKREDVSIDTEGKVYVVDRGNARIQVFAPINKEESK